MLNKKRFVTPALLTGIFFAAIVGFSACNNSAETTDADAGKTADSAAVKTPDTASTRPVIPPTKSTQ